MKTNVEFIQDHVEQVYNQKKIDRWEQDTSQDYFFRTAPYVGTGFSVDSSGDKHIVNLVAPGSPAEGVLQVGDELLWEEDEYQRCDTFEGIKQAVMQGYRGSKFKVGVRRGNQTLEYEFTRDFIEGFEFPKGQVKSNLVELLTKEFPDVKVTIQNILADGELVVCLLEYRGTHADFGREVVWQEAWFVRLSEGKIVEDWSVFDGISYFKQLGYQITPPGS